MTDSLPTADFASFSPDAPDMARLSEALAAIPDGAFAQVSVRGVPEASASRLLALDVLETPEAFEIHASVPGIEPEALDITVLGESVRIAGEGRTAETTFVTEESDYRWLVRERPVGRFDRTVSLPLPVDPSGVGATVRDGVLVVTLPKVRHSTVVRIPVRGEAAIPAPLDAGLSDVIGLSPDA
ncbi:MAG: Hsp20/alpha crystallin family protein [Thermomicrobiales bacterium]